MKGLIAWARSNPISIIAAVIAVVSVALLVWVQMQAGQLTEQVADKRQRDLNQIQNLKSVSLELPPDDPDDPPVRWTGAVNEAAIDALEKVYDRMSQQATGIFSEAVRINRLAVGGQGHAPMLEGLFPEIGNNPGKPYDAKTAYRAAFSRMLKPYEPGAAMPRLNAGRPPSAEQVQQELDAVQQRYLSGFFPPRELSSLNVEERKQLRQMMQSRLKDTLLRRARTIHLYAATPPAGATEDVLPDDVPFDVDLWAREGGRPGMGQMWEGQVGLWIQQDIARAIALANQTDNPESNVLTAPVKRLIAIEVLPGYVGIHNEGLLIGQRSRSTTGAINIYNEQVTSESNQAGQQDQRMMGQPGGDPMMSERSRSGRDSEESAPALNLGDPDRPLPSDFSVSPTGRTSNALYDVKHSRVVMVMDSMQIQRFLEQLASVNFITVLNMTIRDVDEYQALREGFVYGTQDAVEVEMLLESVWLREWTVPLMPPVVRQAVGAVVSEPGESAE